MALVLSICFFGVVLAILHPDHSTDAAQTIASLVVVSVGISVVWVVMEFIWWI